MTVGLPEMEFFHFENEVASLPRVPGQECLRVVGKAQYSLLCVDESSGGAVVCVDEEDSSSIQYVNRHVSALGAFLLIFHNYRTAVHRGVTGSDLRGLKEDAAQRWRIEDPSALEGPESLWSQVLEQMMHGFM